MDSIRVGFAAFMVFLLFCLTGSIVKGTPLNQPGQTVTIVQGQSVTLHAASDNAVTFQWLKDGNAISGATLNSYIVNTPGNYQVLSSNSAGCSSDMSIPVTVNVVPASASADMMLTLTSSTTAIDLTDPFTYTITIKNNGPATATGISVINQLPAGAQFLQLTSPVMGSAIYNTIGNSITWTVDELAPGQETTLTYTVKPIKEGTLTNTATVTAAQGDADLTNNTATITNTITGIKIPNVFTPNGDNVNDVFVIPGLELYPENEFTVINRWGATVYHKVGYQNNWDGSGLNEGTYFYLLRVRTMPQKWDTYKGYLTLLRTKK